MNTRHIEPLQLALRASAVLIGIAAGLHLALGPGADALLGIEAAAAVADDPGLSSQNRFFGVAYALHGAVLWMAASDLPRYRPVLVATLAVTFAAGLSRLVPWLTLGVPPLPVAGLMFMELFLPALLYILMMRRPACPENEHDPSEQALPAD